MPLNQPKPSKRITSAMLRGIAGQTYPQQLYALGLEDLNAKGIRGAKLSGWRFLGKLAGRDMSLDVAQVRGKPAEMTELAHGPHITRARDAIRKIVTLPEVLAQDYELRLLTIPALSVEAVWLKSQTRQPDLIFPYLTTTGLRSMHRYTPDKFFKALEPAAQEVLEFDDSPRTRRRP